MADSARTIWVSPIESDHGAVLMLDKIVRIEKEHVAWQDEHFNAQEVATVVVMMDGSRIRVAESMKTLQACIESE